MLIKVFASGTNVQRLAKGAGRADGVVYTAYSQLEQTEDKIVQRKFYQLEVDTLKTEVEHLDEKVQPSWTKVWGKPYGNRTFISKLLESMVGQDEMRQELNLSNLTGDNIECFMLLTSANKAEMTQIRKIAEEVIPDYHIKVLNGDYTSNKQAQYETKKEIAEAQRAGKKGVIIISRDMGSRSYSISEIQATVICYDRGSVDATTQKVSRCLTPGVTYSGERKEFGHILDLSFDPNRSENIERLLIDEIVMVGKSEDVDFPKATSYVLSSIDMFKVKYGTAVEVSEEDLLGIVGNNENLLRVADVSVDVNSCLDILDTLALVNTDGKQNEKAVKASIDAVNKITEGSRKKPVLSDSDKKSAEKILNDAIRALNMSATSVYMLAGSGDTYAECVENISQSASDTAEFAELFGVGPDIVTDLLDREVLNEPVLDVIVYNSKREILAESPFL
jgi:hypothetical protein